MIIKKKINLEAIIYTIGENNQWTKKSDLQPKPQPMRTITIIPFGKQTESHTFPAISIRVFGPNAKLPWKAQHYVQLIQIGVDKMNGSLIADNLSFINIAKNQCDGFDINNIHEIDIIKFSNLIPIPDTRKTTPQSEISESDDSDDSTISMKRKKQKKHKSSKKHKNI